MGGSSARYRGSVRRQWRRRGWEQRRGGRGRSDPREVTGSGKIGREFPLAGEDGGGSERGRRRGVVDGASGDGGCEQRIGRGDRRGLRVIGRQSRGVGHRRTVGGTGMVTATGTDGRGGRRSLAESREGLGPMGWQDSAVVQRSCDGGSRIGGEGRGRWGPIAGSVEVGCGEGEIATVGVGCMGFGRWVGSVDGEGGS